MLNSDDIPEIAIDEFTFPEEKKQNHSYLWGSLIGLTALLVAGAVTANVLMIAIATVGLIVSTFAIAMIESNPGLSFRMI